LTRYITRRMLPPELAVKTVVDVSSTCPGADGARESYDHYSLTTNHQGQLGFR